MRYEDFREGQRIRWNRPKAGGHRYGTVVWTPTIPGGFPTQEDIDRLPPTLGAKAWNYLGRVHRRSDGREVRVPNGALLDTGHSAESSRWFSPTPGGCEVVDAVPAQLDLSPRSDYLSRLREALADLRPRRWDPDDPSSPWLVLAASEQDRIIAAALADVPATGSPA